VSLDLSLTFNGQSTEAPRVRTRCAWCKALIHDGVLVDGRESHGACKACCDRIRQERREKYEAGQPQEARGR
jgi:hypothetical protein